MANRKRPNQQSVYFTDSEWDAIQAQMSAAGVTNFSLFAREMLLNGEVKCYDFTVLKDVSRELARLAGSINQIAKRCNETRSIHTAEVEQIRRDYLAVKGQVQGQLIRLLRRI